MAYNNAIATASIASRPEINFQGVTSDDLFHPYWLDESAGAGQITAGDGLDKSGNTMSVRVDNVTLDIDSDIIGFKGVDATANGDVMYGAGGSNGGFSRLSIGTYDSTNSVGQLLQVGGSSTVTWSNTLDGGTF